MLIESSRAQLSEIVAFSWGVQASLESASYPLYASKKDLRSAMEKCLQSDQDKLLVCYDGIRLIGAVNLMVEKENHYLQAAGIYAKVNPRQIYEELLPWLAERYSGFALFFGYPPENTEALQVMKEIAAECVDSCVALCLVFQSFAAYPLRMDVWELDIRHFDEFAAFYDALHPEMYWSSDKIKNNLDKWRIFLLQKESAIEGCILYSMWNPKEAEIFALTITDAYKSTETASVLLSQTLPAVFSASKHRVLYMADEAMIWAVEAAYQVGFQKTGGYQGFRLIL